MFGAKTRMEGRRKRSGHGNCNTYTSVMIPIHTHKLFAPRRTSNFVSHLVLYPPGKSHFDRLVVAGLPITRKAHVEEQNMHKFSRYQSSRVYMILRWYSFTVYYYRIQATPVTASLSLSPPDTAAQGPRWKGKEGEDCAQSRLEVWSPIQPLTTIVRLSKC